MGSRKAGRSDGVDIVSANKASDRGDSDIRFYNMSIVVPSPELWMLR